METKEVCKVTVMLLKKVLDASGKHVKKSVIRGDTVGESELPQPLKKKKASEKNLIINDYWMFGGKKKVCNCFVWCVNDTDSEVGQVWWRRKHTGCFWKEPARVCLSEDLTSLSWCANICSNFFLSSHYRCAPGGFAPAFTQLEQSFQKCHSISCWVRAARALKLRIHRGWREKRHEIMSRDSPSIVQISSVTYIYIYNIQFFFFSPS